MFVHTECRRDDLYHTLIFEFSVFGKKPWTITYGLIFGVQKKF